MHERDKIVIGWVEPVEFVDWGIPRIRAKVDTGARTSSLHVEDVTELPDGRVRFHVIADRKHPEARYEVDAPLVKKARVRSSTGKYTMRCFIKTRVKVGDVVKEIELSLAPREKMVFRMLLGRTALHDDFVVDVSMRHLTSPKKKRKHKPS